MNCRQTERERERGKEGETQRRYYVENEIEAQARQPHLGAMCTACYMAIEIKIEHG